MITTGNYAEKIKEVGIENLNATLKEYHKDLKEATNDFTDWTDYNEDADIKEATDLYFKEIEKLLSDENSGKGKKPKKEPTVKPVVASKSKTKSEPRHEKYHIGQKVKLIANGEEGTITNVFVVKSGRFIPGQGAEDPKVEYSLTVKTKDSIKTVNEDEIKLIAHFKKEPKSEVKEEVDSKQVENIAEDVKFIKSFVGLHNKTKTYWSIRNLLARLQKAIVQKIISKKSAFAEEIKIIQDRLIKIVNASEESGSLKITIDDKLLNKLIPIAGGEKVYGSIGYIKRFIGMQGKHVEKDKASALVTQIEKAIEKGKIDKSDPYLSKVKFIIKSLNSYIAGKEKLVSISQAELNGLMGILGCDCPSGLGSIEEIETKEAKTIKPVNNPSSGKRQAVIMSAEQVANMRFKLLPFTGIFKEIIGMPEKNFTMMVNGEPGAGKTVFLMKFIKFFSGIGSVLFVTSEEFGSTTLTEKVNTYLNPIPSNVHFTSDLNSINVSDYDLVVFDSINDLGIKLEDFKVYKKENPQTAFILVLQNTKNGQFKGGKEWEHEVQVAGEIDNGVITIYKNRYGLKGQWNFFEDDYSIAA